MRIGIDISQIAYPYTGVANYTKQLVENLLKIDRDNEYVLFGSSLRRLGILKEFQKDSLNKYSNVRTKFYKAPLSLLEILWNQIHRGSIERLTGKLDIFHSSDWLEPPSQARKITTIHDLVIYKFPEFMHPKIVGNQKLKLGWVKKESQLIIADSESTKQDIMEYMKISGEKIRVVYLGVDPCFYPQSTNEIERVRRKYGINKDYFMVLGTEPRKNINRLVDAFNFFHNKNIELVVAGKFMWGEKIVATKNIHVIGQVDMVDLPALYTGALALAYPSLYEGFGLPVLSALASGTRVITSNRGSLKEVGGNTVIIVDPENTESIEAVMQQIWQESAKDRQIKIGMGQLWAKRFSWEKTARQVLDIYKLVGEN